MKKHHRAFLSETSAVSDMHLHAGRTSHWIRCLRVFQETCPVGVWRKTRKLNYRTSICDIITFTWNCDLQEKSKKIW